MTIETNSTQPDEFSQDQPVAMVPEHEHELDPEVLSLKLEIAKLTEDNAVWVAIDMLRERAFSILMEEKDHALRIANIDKLTELENQTAWRAGLDNEVEISLREGRHVAMCFLDLDRFKQVNDKLGHSKGDELLKAYAEKLSILQEILGPSVSISRTRLSSRAGRLGGDEFGIYSVVSDPAEYEAFKELINSMNGICLSSAPFAEIVDEVKDFGVSVGFASTLDNIRTGAELAHAADQDMYRVKAMNGGRVTPKES